jgi:hypothetical protein
MAKIRVNNAWFLIVDAKNGSNWTRSGSVALAASNTLIGVDKGFLQGKPSFSCLSGV